MVFRADRLRPVVIDLPVLWNQLAATGSAGRLLENVDHADRQTFSRLLIRIEREFGNRLLRSGRICFLRLRLLLILRLGLLLILGLVLARQIALPGTLALRCLLERLIPLTTLATLSFLSLAKMPVVLLIVVALKLRLRGSCRTKESRLLNEMLFV